MSKRYNLARMTTATTGTGTITLGSASAGFLSFANAGIADGDTVTYAIKDGSNSEIGRGVYTASGTTLSRSVLKSTNSNTPISLSGSAVVVLTAAAEDFLQPENYSLAASVASNALTITLNGYNGSTPSLINEIALDFRSATAATGTLTSRSVVAANTLVVSSGSTLGTANSVPFRLWVVLFDDAGTMRLGAIQRITGGSTPTAMTAVSDDSLASSTAEGGAGAADSAGVFYTGTAVTSKAYRILGYMEWSSGLATAGTWASGPTKIQMFGPGVPAPGAQIQTVQTYTSTSTATTSTTYVNTNAAASITPAAACNLVKCEAVGVMSSASNAGSADAASFRGSTQIGTAVQAYSSAGQSIAFGQFSCLDAPMVATSTTYTVKLKSSGGQTSSFGGGAGGGGGTAVVILTEIQA